ncbi:arginyl-tRNA--protein transferase 1 isoform X5 [Neodiprion fabricii]|uniref:arginyl-tRNA--protein transferase 1 isoform X5 n=1 Tax=Neodiprion fabricii TaxID=2872261 RepID=UPI001ED92436|nr:arginyl-tRNA--protein transferase 1 isoform X5 [Neodiprion fabricii]
MSRKSPSLVEYFAEREKHKCGYCKSPDTNCSHGMWAYTLKVQDYQDLIDRGWRRSGNYCYKPIMDQTCCPMYTIKCEALDFKISKSQKKLMKRMSKFLKGELKKNDTALCDEFVQDDSDSRLMEVQNCAEQVERARNNATNIDVSLIADTLDLRLPSPTNSTNSQSITESSYSAAKLRLVRTSPMSSEYISTSKQSYELYKKYQMAIHKDRAEQVTQQQYTRFLVESPLQEWVPADGPPQGYGSFHQQYWLNNQLIAVGVIDILPSCISSVYFFYDPIYSHISLGTYGSLREVMLTRQLNKLVPNLKYYYMGFYIHTCLKMRYKAGLRPSKLLCPETYVWCDIENCLPKLDKEKYSRLNEDLDAIDQNLSNDITQVSVCYNRKIIPYHIYKKQAYSSADEDEIREYSHLVGTRCARNLALYRR